MENVQFVIQNGMRVNLVEVKSGNDFKVRSAMNRIRKVENWTFGQYSVFCKGNLETDGGSSFEPVRFLRYGKMYSSVLTDQTGMSRIRDVPVSVLCFCGQPGRRRCK